MDEPILFNDFKRQWKDLRADALEAVDAVGESGWFILGREVTEFEREIAERWTRPLAVGVASGLDALEISLRALGCSAGDLVLTSPISAFATTLAIVKLGATPVFVDCDRSGLIDLAACRALLVRRPDIRYFVPVHLYGHSLDMDELGRLRDDFALKIVEDCAQSVGARCRGRNTGTAGQMAASSFYPTKSLGAWGDGGIILTADEDLAGIARTLRDYGQSRKYRHEEVGYNSRLDELQAALLRRVALPRLSTWLDRRRQIAEVYLREIRNSAVQVPGVPAGSESGWHLFPVLVPPKAKMDFARHLLRHGISTAEHYPLALPDQPVMARVRSEVHGCEVARNFCASEVSIPIHPYLRDEEIGRIVDACNSWAG